MIKNIIITIVSIIAITIVLILMNNFIYGTDTIYIADYMPGPMEEKMPPFLVVAIENLIGDMTLAIIIGIIIATIERKILYKKNIFEKNKIDKILIVLIYIIPIAISAIKLFLLYGYTC